MICLHWKSEDCPAVIHPKSRGTGYALERHRWGKIFSNDLRETAGRFCFVRSLLFLSVAPLFLQGGHGPAVDYILGSMNRRGAVAGKKSCQFGDLFGKGGPS